MTVIPRVSVGRLLRSIRSCQSPARCSAVVDGHNRATSTKRRLSTYTSQTAINPPTTTSTIPDSNRALHAALTAVAERAPEHIDPSNLSLARRSLESATPTLRIGIFGLGRHGDTAARKIVGLVCADALSSAQAWEETIRDSKGPVLLRYGDNDVSSPGSSHGLTDQGLALAVPSRWLKQHRIEMLIMGLEEHVRVGKDILLTPVLSAGGAAVRFPVHRALIVGHGVDGAMGIGRVQENAGELVSVVVDGPGFGQDQSSTATDVDLAVDSLATFRHDAASGTAFSTAWQVSGIDRVATWMAGTGSSVTDYINTLLASTDDSITAAEDSARSALGSTSVPESRREVYQKTISEWSTYAHTNLQMSVARATSSPAWRRTAWTRLLWSVDDVSAAVDDVVRYWLVGAEAHMAYLSGSINGMLSESPATGMTDFHVHDSRSAWEWDLYVQAALTGDRVDVNDTPWPTGINLARRQLRTLGPDLQARAQGLLAQSLAVVGGTSALGVWMYVSAFTGLYGSGAVAALGLVSGLRYLQRSWTTERANFQGKLHETGREVLRDIERAMRGQVRDGQRPTVDAGDVQRWQDARRAVSACRDLMK